MIFLLFLSVLIIANAKNMTKLKFRCEDWRKEYPFQNGVLDNCSMEIDPISVTQFLFNLKSRDFHWELFRFNLRFKPKEVFKTKCAIEPHIWTWTYPAPEGAYEFLKWPKEYGIWSFGLLDLFSYSMNIKVNVYGNCPVIIGGKETTQRIATAVLEMVNKSTTIKGAPRDFLYGSVCYNSKVFIHPFIYFLCKHISCPVEATSYRCCTANETSIVCNGENLHYDGAWWGFPFVLGLLLFAFSPLFLVKVFKKVASSNTGGHIQIDDTMNKGSNKWLICNPLSLFSIVSQSITPQNNKFLYCRIILRRVAIVLMTITVVIVQVGIHYFFDHHYTVELAKHDIPLDFRSMVAGYKRSKTNFIPTIGGPYVGLGIYLFTTMMLVCIPRDLETFINRGIPNNLGLSMSPLTLDIKTKGKLGSVYHLERQSGYPKLYNLMRAHIYMLINPSFWSLAIQIQVKRFAGVMNNITKGKATNVVKIGFGIPYFVLICATELFLSLIYYSLPIILFFKITIMSYYIGIKKSVSHLGTSGRVVQYSITTLTLAILVFNLYILTVVFVDSLLFITRIMIFTFTGFIAYPGSTYAYFVFAMTIVIYITESIHKIRLTYSKLFKYTIKSCVVVKNKNKFPEVGIAKEEDDYYMISRELFTYVVSRHKPVRVEIFFSLLKLAFITFMFYLAAHVIVTLHRLTDLNPLTQVITALFICLLPKLWRMLLLKDKNYEDIQENIAILKLVEDYCKQKLQIRDSDENTSVELDNFNSKEPDERTKLIN